MSAGKFDLTFFLDPSASSEKDAKEELKLFKSGKYLDSTMKSLKRRRYHSNTKLRILMTYWSAALITFWLIFEAVIICKNREWHLKLSDSVLITFLTTTTASVIGIVAIAMKDLFNGKSEQEIKQKHNSKTS